MKYSTKELFDFIESGRRVMIDQSEIQSIEYID